MLFADVKGSMELAEQVDPEEWHRILDRFFQNLADGVHRFEGTVNQYTGDGIMALFGAPIAHEDHAQRACCAALALCEQLRKYAQELRMDRSLNFSVRLGLNSGEVVVGKIGDDLRMDYTAQRHTVGLAQRVEQLAEPGHAYLSQHTARLVEGFFQLLDLGESKIAGTSEPLRVYELQGVGPLRSPLEVSARRGLVRFVGREREMGELERAWEAAQAGRGQILAVLGEAGVGKSRLLHEFKGLVGSGCRVLEGFSVSHGKASAYLPLLELLKGYFRIRVEDDERRRREKVTGTVLALDRTLEDTLPYLFTLLGIGDRTGSLEQMDPQIRRQRALEAVKRVLVRETLNQPCVLLFEDLHWIDSETQAFLDVLVDSVATARLLLLVNYRPEYGHGWGSRTCYTQLRLDPFGAEESRELLGALLGEGAGEEREALDRLILSKTQGNPFFLEELSRGLSHLQVAEFIYERPAFPDPEYTFKHALTQEVAYGSLLRERRRVLHERTGQAIEALNPQGLDAHYEELAHHYGRSANTPKAVEYLRLAGEQAIERSAYGEAIDRLRQALEQQKTLPETRERDELDLVLQCTLGQALHVTEGFASVETEQAYARARDLARRLGDASHLFEALNGLRAGQQMRAEHDKSRLLAEELLRVARQTGDPGQILCALVAMGATSFLRGEHCEAREHLEELLGLYDPKKHRGHDYLSASSNVGVLALFYSSWTLFWLGYPEQALTRAREALALARELSHTFSEATALNGLGIVHLLRRDSEASLKVTEALIVLSEEHGFPYWLAFGTMCRFAALTERRELEKGITGMRSILEGLRARGALAAFSWFLATLAVAHGKAGQVEEGLAVVAEGLEFATKTGERYAEAELHRTKAELLLARTAADPAGAEASFRDALEVARRQRAKSYELRAATGLARLWQQQGRKQEARDLKEAKALLEELV